ncbi:MAG: hypothetical protein JW395_0804 [Nitrospira sp.]|nr:hypothetical protein [Nitrospira sp.]
MSGPHDTVASADGSAELLIPQGALPAGTSASQLKVAPLAPSEILVRFKDGSPASGYRLEPDGLTFSKPAVLRIKRDASDSTLPLVLLLSKGQPAALRTALEIDRKRGTAVVSAVIPHFSEMYIGRGFFRLEFMNLRDQVVNQPFPAESLLSLLTTSIEWTFENQQWRAEIENPVADGGWVTLIGDLLKPDRVPNSPILPLENGVLISNQSFTCVREGPTSITRYSNALHDLYFVHPDGTRRQSTYFPDTHEFGSLDHALFCVGDGSSTPTPTVTPTPTATPEPVPGTQMLRLPNGHYPLTQFHLAQPDPGCSTPHWHSGAGTVYGLSEANSTAIVTATDPARNGCGFGGVNDVPAAVLRLNAAQTAALQAAMSGGR